MSVRSRIEPSTWPTRLPAIHAHTTRPSWWPARVGGARAAPNSSTLPVEGVVPCRAPSGAVRYGAGTGHRRALDATAHEASRGSGSGRSQTELRPRRCPPASSATRTPHLAPPNRKALLISPASVRDGAFPWPTPPPTMKGNHPERSFLVAARSSARATQRATTDSGGRVWCGPVTTS